MSNPLPAKVKVFNKLSDTFDFITKKHRDINGARNGVIGYKMIRKPSGRRILFEEINGFRIFKFEVVDENSVVVDTLASGFSFKNNEKITVSSRMFLTNLMVVNIYDHRADFFSLDSIDFMYIENNQTKYQILSEWMHNKHSELRAQWTSRHDDVDKILEEITADPKCISHDQTDRFLNLDTSITSDPFDRSVDDGIIELPGRDIYDSEFEV